MSDSGGDARPAAAAGDGWETGRRTLGGLLGLANRLLGAEFHRRLDAAGYADVRAGSGHVFEHIGPAGSTISAMARRSGVSPQAMVQIVDYLEGRGYVERVPDRHDRRAKLVRLTDRGRRADEVSRRLLAEVEREWAGVVGEARFLAVYAALDDLVAAASGAASTAAD